MLCVAICLSIASEIFALGISYFVSLILIWCPILLWALWSVYMEYYSLTEGVIEKTLLSIGRAEDDWSVVNAIYEIHGIAKDASRRKNCIWMEGYLKMHRVVCTNSIECACCYYSKQVSKQENKKQSNKKEINGGIIRMHEKNLIRDALIRFPRSISLKLAYLSLASRNDQKDSSYIQQMADDPTMNYVVKFALARYEGENKKKKSLEEKMETGKQIVLDTSRALDKFWELMEEESPDAWQVYMAGNEAFMKLKYLKKVQKSWNEKINDDSFDAHKIYRYLIRNVFWENVTYRESSKTSIERSTEDRGWARISTKTDSFGLITECNQAFGKLFGFPKGELIGIQANLLVPKIYSKTEEKIRQFIFDAYWKESEGKQNLSFFAFGKHRNEYIFPIQLMIEKLPSAFKDQDLEIHIDIDRKNFHPKILYVVTDETMKISNYSSSNHFIII